MLVVSVFWYLGLSALRLNIHRANEPGFLFIFYLISLWVLLTYLLTPLFCFLCCFVFCVLCFLFLFLFLCFVCINSVSCVTSVTCVWIVHSWLPSRISIAFMYQTVVLKLSTSMCLYTPRVTDSMFIYTLSTCYVVTDSMFRRFIVVFPNLDPSVYF